MNKKKIYQNPEALILSVTDVIRTSRQKAPLKTSENGFGDEVDF